MVKRREFEGAKQGPKLLTELGITIILLMVLVPFVAYRTITSLAAMGCEDIIPSTPIKHFCSRMQNGVTENWPGGDYISLKQRRVYQPQGMYGWHCAEVPVLGVWSGNYSWRSSVVHECSARKQE
jgi:hypothetical protein